MSITTLFLTIVVGLLAVLHNVDAGCPASFTSFEGYCYMVDTSSKKEWADALNSCLVYGATLASIHNSAEEAFVEALVRAKDTRAHMGLNDMVTEGVYKWADQTKLDYTSWNSKEPNNDGGGEDCGEITSSGWNDLECFQKRDAVCKMPDV